jgi:osmoprotectant transport system ATP-binding protein
MGDRIAIMRAGKLVQYDTPEAILARPADAFVEEFVGVDRVLKRLSLLKVRDHVERDVAAPAGDLRVRTGATLRGALTLLLVNGVDTATVVDEANVVVGAITLARIRAAIHAHDADAAPKR